MAKKVFVLYFVLTSQQVNCVIKVLLLQRAAISDNCQFVSCGIVAFTDQPKKLVTRVLIESQLVELELDGDNP